MRAPAAPGRRPAADSAERAAAQLGRGGVPARVHVSDRQCRCAQSVARDRGLSRDGHARRQARRPAQGRAGPVQDVRTPLTSARVRRRLSDTGADGDRGPEALPFGTLARFVLDDQGRAPVFKTADGPVAQLREVFAHETDPLVLFDSLFAIQKEVRVAAPRLSVEHAWSAYTAHAAASARPPPFSGSRARARRCLP